MSVLAFTPLDRRAEGGCGGRGGGKSLACLENDRWLRVSRAWGEMQERAREDLACWLGTWALHLVSKFSTRGHVPISKDTFFFSSFSAVPMAYGNSQARDRIPVAAATYTTAAARQILNPLCPVAI